MVTGNWALLEAEALASEVDVAGPVEQAESVTAAARMADAPADLSSVRRVVLGPVNREEAMKFLK